MFHGVVPYSSVFIDASSWDFVSAAGKCFSSSVSDSCKSERIVKRLFETEQNPSPALPCLSVRSAFDMFLSVMKFPPGSQILMTAVNIPGMVEIVRHHQLIPVSLVSDIGLCTLGPTMEDCESRVTSKTVAILVAHLFGRWTDISPLVSLCRTKGLLLVEDCAECFDGFAYLGHPLSDLVLFSFGVIKQVTCFGGAVAKVRDRLILDGMRNVQSAYPVQSGGQYLSKVIKYFLISPALNCPRVMKPGMTASRFLGADHKAFMVNMLRGFPGELVQNIRLRPSAALLSFMSQRLMEAAGSSGKQREMATAVEKGEFAVRVLSISHVKVPGEDVFRKGHWLFPVVVENPEKVCELLNSWGVDAYTKSTQLALINSESNVCTSEAEEMMRKIVFLPIHKNVPYKEINHICSLVCCAVDYLSSHCTSLPKAKL